MNEEPTTAAIQRYLDALPQDAAAELIVRELWSGPSPDIDYCAPLFSLSRLSATDAATAQPLATQ
jgi:hypothetical protein